MKPALRWIPTEVWVDILCFPWISRKEMGQLVDQIGNRKFAEFLQFYLHDWGKRSLGFLNYGKEGLYNYHGENERRILPIAQTPMPENIKSFNNIYIIHFDAQLIDFLRLIQPLFANVIFFTYMLEPAHLRTILARLAPLLGGIASLWFLESLGKSWNANLPPARQWECFAAECGDQLAKLKMLRYSHDSVWGPEPLAEQVAAVKASINFFLNWLTSERDSAEPRMFDTSFRVVKLFQLASTAIQENFLSAKRPCTFVAYLDLMGGRHAFDPIADFHVENSIGEQLHGRKIESEYGDYKHFLITRHQPNAGTRLQQWVEQFEQKHLPIKSRLDLWETTIGYFLKN